MPLALPILLGNCNEFIVEFGVDLRGELLSRMVLRLPVLKLVFDILP